LVNNAGFGLSGEFLNHSSDIYRQQMMLNITSVVEMTHYFFSKMVAKGNETIITLASLLSFFPFPYCSVYSATKAFVLSFTESLWEEYRHKGIKLLALCPGPTDTKFINHAVHSPFGVGLHFFIIRILDFHENECLL
jgi:short-subunit dehydrogenase